MSNNRPYRDDPNAEEVEASRGEETLVVEIPPANSHFKRSLKYFTLFASLISVLTIGLLIAVSVLLQIWDFDYARDQSEAVRDLAIVLVVVVILFFPTFFIEFPILINIIIHVVMTIVAISFSAVIFQYSWPTVQMCMHYNYGGPNSGNGRWSTPTEECKKQVGILEIMMGVAGGCGIFIGILIIAVLFLRVVALLRTRFWQDKRFTRLFSLDAFSKFSGFTVQLSFSIIPVGTLPVVVDSQQQPKIVASAESSERERLIET